MSEARWYWENFRDVLFESIIPIAVGAFLVALLAVLGWGAGTALLRWMGIS